jgi:hypothetical protein
MQTFSLTIVVQENEARSLGLYNRSIDRFIVSSSRLVQSIRTLLSLELKA